MIILSMWDCVYAQFPVKLQCFPACSMLQRLPGVGFSARTVRKFSNTLLLSWHAVLCPKPERTLQWELKHAANHGDVLRKPPRQYQDGFAADGK